MTWRVLARTGKKLLPVPGHCMPEKRPPCVTLVVIEVPRMDLRNGPPRSPYATLGGVQFLPRSIDKMRAEIAGTQGDYNASTGYSKQVYKLFGTDAATFASIVRAHPTDDGVLASLRAIRTPTDAEIARFNGSVITKIVNFVVARTETKPTKAG